MITKSLGSTEEVFRFAAAFAPTLGNEVANVFRGHSDKQFKLEPTLVRLLRQRVRTEEDAVTIESQLLHEYRQRSKHLRPPESGGTWAADSFEIYHLQSMQHFGAPTRLLDWTKSFYVALYFAVSDHPDTDGSIHVASAGRIASKSSLEQWPQIKKWPQNPKDFLQYRDSDPFPMLYKPNFDFDRGIVQQGLFIMPSRLLCDHNTMYETALSHDSAPLTKVIIPKALKPTLLAQLAAMNVTPATLFPGLDGVARSVHDLAMITTSKPAG